MATAEIHAALKKGVTFVDLLGSLKAVRIDGKPINLSVDHRCLPYLDHVVEGFGDGPMASAVEAVFSGRDPHGHLWRRFTLQRLNAGEYRLAAFPTPFGDANAPLSPGIPPSATRH